MKVNLSLADYVQATPDGKATAVGIGWTFTSAEGSTFGVLAQIEVPWTATNQNHHAELRLQDADGNQVTGPDGNAVKIDTDFEVGRPPGHPAGVPLNVFLPINVHGLSFTPGTRYEWVLSVDGNSEEGWRAGFCVRPQPPVSLAG